MPTVVLDAGILDLTATGQAGGAPDTDAFWELRGPGDVTDYGYGTGHRVIPAGEYGLSVTLGAAEISQTVTIVAGQVTDLDIVLGTGIAALSPWFTDAVEDTSQEAFIEVFDARTALDGTRTSRAYGYGASTFDLPPGDYVAVITRDGVTREQPFAVATGQRTDLRLVMNAGIAAITIPADTFVELLPAQPDINGNQVALDYGYGPGLTSALPAGDYVARATLADATSETPFTVVAGERVELALPAP
jgi:Ca-activated chloride channel homolog